VIRAGDSAGFKSSDHGSDFNMSCFARKRLHNPNPSYTFARNVKRR
jgi:hypothetical protein